MQINKNKLFTIPSNCPKCDTKLRHVNALNTEAKCYFVYCPIPQCRFCREYKICPNCGEYVCL